jgi:hypothetical protein
MQLQKAQIEAISAMEEMRHRHQSESHSRLSESAAPLVPTPLSVSVSISFSIFTLSLPSELRRQGPVSLSQGRVHQQNH